MLDKRFTKGPDAEDICFYPYWQCSWCGVEAYAPDEAEFGTELKCASCGKATSAHLEKDDYGDEYLMTWGKVALQT